jgi:TrmH family RNA methyltransferase
MARLDRIRIVLVAPLYGGNVGSVCRAMANTGLTDLVLVAPQTIDMEEARKMAVNAGAILEARREVATLAEAVADCGLVMGATARIGLYRQHAVTPRELAPRALEAAEQSPVALVFGREDKGLFNEEIALCTQLIRIPSHPAYTSLNLAQAVMVCAYELFTAAGIFEPSVEKSAEAPGELRERLFAIWRDVLLDIGFMNDDKADHMMLGLRRVWSRGKMTVDDVNILMGIARQMRWRAEHPGNDSDR